VAHYEESLIVKAPPQRVYEVTKDVAGFMTRVPGFSVTVLEKNERQVLFKVASRYLLIIKSGWQTLADISNHQEIQFNKLKGVFRGLLASWQYTPVPEGTKITITHDFDYQKPVFWARWLLRSKSFEKWLYGYTIQPVARGILQDMKARLEEQQGN